jgi:hypothetical protein
MMADQLVVLTVVPTAGWTVVPKAGWTVETLAYKLVGMSVVDLVVR